MTEFHEFYLGVQLFFQLVKHCAKEVQIFQASIN